MPTVSVPKSFFKKERDIYWNWPEAFWRELFQNSSDAGARRIDVEVTEAVVDGLAVTRVKFKDNGCGMDKNVLDDVYFALGGTTKLAGDAVGGFGRARILTCFSMERYGIRTKNWVVEGNGAEYEVTESADHVKGCHLEIDIESSAGDSYDMLYRLRDYLAHCHSPKIDIYINGEKWSDWCHKGRHIRNISVDGEHYGSIYAVKNGGQHASSTIVRVDGIMMFTLSHNAQAQIVVEIDKSKALKALVAGRDSFAYGYGEPVTSFIRELSINCLSATSDNQRRNLTVRGRGFRVTTRPLPSETETVEEQGALDEQASEQYSYDEQACEQYPHNKNSVAALSPPSSRPRKPEATSASTFSETFEAEDGDATLFDVYILNESQNAKVSRVVSRYNPRNWKTVQIGGRETSQGSTVKKLLRQWEIAINAAVLALLEKSGDESLAWASGWVFSGDMDAAHRQFNEGHVFYLNPVDPEGKLSFKLRDRRSQKRLMALAKHEVAHAVRGDHDERFANALTRIDEAYDERFVFAAMKAAL